MGHAVSKISAKPLHDLVRLHNLSIPEIGKRTGISTSALHAWSREGKMPAYMGPVCVGLLAQIRGQGSRTDVKESKDQAQTLIVRLPEADRERAYKLLDAIGAQYRSIEDFSK